MNAFYLIENKDIMFLEKCSSIYKKDTLLFFCAI